MRQAPDKELILDSLAAIARGAGRPPSRSEFVSLSGISEHQVSRFFPTWNAALRAAGLRPYTLNLRLDDRELLEDWGNAVRRNRKIPAVAPTITWENSTSVPSSAASAPGRSFPTFFAISPKTNRNGPMSWLFCQLTFQSLRQSAYQTPRQTPLQAQHQIPR